MRGQWTRRALLRLAAATGMGTTTAGGAAAAAPSDASGIAGGQTDWYGIEFRNYAKTQEAPAEQVSDPDFASHWHRRSRRNAADYVERAATESGWRSHANRCATWSQQSTGDPLLYRDEDARGFYGPVGERRRVAFYDRQGARLSGHVWTPVDAAAGDGLPGVVITNGSSLAPEPVYWWAAQALVEAGYVVLTYDPRGQGRSDGTTPEDSRVRDADGEVFVANQVDAVDFARSTPADPYEPNGEYARGDGAPVELYNPAHDRIDRDRIGVAGHSAGAIGASIVQGLDPWPTGGDNPVDAVVAWDNLGDAADVGRDTDATDGDGSTRFFDAVPRDDVEPRVPAMGQTGDYFLTPTPHERPPNPEAKAGGFRTWRDAGVPTYQLVVRGGTHYEWSRIPTFPATSWTFGNALAEHYTVAWFDRWLKDPTEDGSGDADERLLADDEWADHLSFHFNSKRAFRGRDQQYHESDDIRANSDSPIPPGE